MDNKGQQRSRRKTIKTVEKTGDEEEIDKKKGSENVIENAEKEKSKVDALKDEVKKEGIELKEEEKAAETLALTEEEKAMLAKNTEDTKKREMETRDLVESKAKDAQGDGKENNKAQSDKEGGKEETGGENRLSDTKDNAENKQNDANAPQALLVDGNLKDKEKNVEDVERTKELAKSDIPSEELEEHRKKLEQEEEEILQKLHSDKKEQDMSKANEQDAANNDPKADKDERSKQPKEGDMKNSYAIGSEDAENREYYKKKHGVSESEMKSDDQKDILSKDEGKKPNEEDKGMGGDGHGKEIAMGAAAVAAGAGIAAKSGSDKKEIPDDEDNASQSVKKGGNMNTDPETTEDKHVEINENKNEEKVIPGVDDDRSIDNTSEENRKNMAAASIVKAKNDEENANRANDANDDKQPATEGKQKDDAEMKKTKESQEGEEKHMAAAGVIAGGSANGKQFKPIIDDNVEKEAANIGPGTDEVLNPADPHSEIGMARGSHQVVYEGFVWKKRYIFRCFWHQRYYVLTKDGYLRYYRKMNGKSKSNINIVEATDLIRVDEPNSKQPYKIMLRYHDNDEIIGFVLEPERDRWASKLGECRRNLI